MPTSSAMTAPVRVWPWCGSLVGLLCLEINRWTSATHHLRGLPVTEAIQEDSVGCFSDLRFIFGFGSDFFLRFTRVSISTVQVEPLVLEWPRCALHHSLVGPQWNHPFLPTVAFCIPHRIRCTSLYID